MQQCNQQTIPKRQREPRFIRRNWCKDIYLHVYFLSLSFTASCWWACWWNINEFTWISISILKSSPASEQTRRDKGRKTKCYRNDEFIKTLTEMLTNEASNTQTVGALSPNDWWGVKSRYPSLSEDETDGKNKSWWKWRCGQIGGKGRFYQRTNVFCPVAYHSIPLAVGRQRNSLETNF